MKLITVLGTRPEIIRMACIIKELDKFTDILLSILDKTMIRT